jgi:hypothetical protein
MRFAPSSRRVAVPATLASSLLLGAAAWAGCGRLGEAGTHLADATAPLLVASAVASGLGLALAGLAWRSALAREGEAPARGDAIARYAVGSLVNAGAPLRLGAAVRFGLFAHAAGVRRATAAAAGVGASRSLCLLALAPAAVVAGVAPWWVGALPLAAAAAATVVALAVCRGAVSTVRGALPWIGAATLARLAAAAAGAAALDVERPLLTALVVLPAVELAATLPLTPGNLGLGTAAAALAFASCGAAPPVALAAALALGLCETAAALGLGAAGLLVLRPRPGGGQARPRLPLAPLMASAR